MATQSIDDLRKAMAKKVADAKALAATYQGKESEMPKDVIEKINGLLGESDVIKAQILTLQRVEEGDQFVNSPQDLKAGLLGWRQSGPDEGNVAVDPMSWRKMELVLPTGKRTELRYQVPLAVQGKAYPLAFEAYVRKGFDYMGPQDRKTLNEGTDSAGGFLVPEDYQTEFIRKTATNAVIRSLARVLSTSRDIMKWPRLAYTTDDKYTSGARLTWTGELPASATAHRVTEPVIGLLSIPIHTAMASLPLSNDLLEDAAFDVAGIGTDLLGEAFGLGEDDVFLNGNGVSKPMGILTRVDVGDEKIATVASGSASTLTADGLIDLFFGLPSQYRRNARFVMNSATAKVARKLKDGNQRYLWDAMQTAVNGGLYSPAEQDTLIGKPVAYDEFAVDIAANSYPIIFGDFTGYFIVDRVGLSIQRLSELYAETNITLLLARKRVGGDVTQPWRLKVQKITT
jgi:HK97 family phage major capsid protein